MKRFVRPPGEVTVYVAQNLCVVLHCQLEHILGPDLTVPGLLHHQLHPYRDWKSSLSPSMATPSEKYSHTFYMSILNQELLACPLRKGTSQMA